MPFPRLKRASHEAHGRAEYMTITVDTAARSPMAYFYFIPHVFRLGLLSARRHFTAHELLTATYQKSAAGAAAPPF